jgi:hypothetical protein
MVTTLNPLKSLPSSIPSTSSLLRGASTSLSSGASTSSRTAPLKVPNTDGQLIASTHVYFGGVPQLSVGTKGKAGNNGYELTVDVPVNLLPSIVNGTPTSLSVVGKGKTKFNALNRDFIGEVELQGKVGIENLSSWPRFSLQGSISAGVENQTKIPQTTPKGYPVPNTVGELIKDGKLFGASFSVDDKGLQWGGRGQVKKANEYPSDNSIPYLTVGPVVLGREGKLDAKAIGSPATTLLGALVPASGIRSNKDVLDVKASGKVYIDFPGPANIPSTIQLKADGLRVVFKPDGDDRFYFYRVGGPADKKGELKPEASFSPGEFINNINNGIQRSIPFLRPNSSSLQPGAGSTPNARQPIGMANAGGTSNDPGFVTKTGISVGGRAPSGAAVQGNLYQINGTAGSHYVFGKSPTNGIRIDASSQEAARERARQLIQFGGISEGKLMPLDPKYLKSSALPGTAPAGGASSTPESVVIASKPVIGPALPGNASKLTVDSSVSFKGIGTNPLPASTSGVLALNNAKLGTTTASSPTLTALANNLGTRATPALPSAAIAAKPAIAAPAALPTPAVAIKPVAAPVLTTPAVPPAASFKPVTSPPVLPPSIVAAKPVIAPPVALPPVSIAAPALPAVSSAPPVLKIDSSVNIKSLTSSLDLSKLNPVQLSALSKLDTGKLSALSTLTSGGSLRLM